ncbi:MAG: cytochrome c [Alphaproteobacteria bacterium]|nr:cytochrome c [Alphaproteobacteria bacterium]
MLRLAALSLVVLSTAASAQSLPGSVVDGRELALRICSDCHVVSPRQTRSPTDAAPPFSERARDPAITPLSLRVFLQTPHARMPDLSLTRSEIDDLIAYILSLRN